MTACSDASGPLVTINYKSGRERVNSAATTKGPARIVHALIIDYKILTFAKATLFQYRAERLIRDCCRRVVEGRPQDAQPNEPVRLLRARRERPSRRRAAE
jgi:hypothetical protein